MFINPAPTTYNLGGKGYQLSQLSEFCPVPKYFVICFENNDEIDSIEIQGEVIKVFESCGFDYVSVRSSATVEDSDVASFAGMFTTKLNVHRNNLIKSIKEVAGSSKNERVNEYCALKGLDAKNIQVRVIVQKMVGSKVSGVCITKDIGNPDIILIEACWGIGEALVSGMVAPDTYKVNRNDYKIESISIGFQKKMVVPFSSDKIQDVPFHLRNAKKLKEIELLELCRICLFIENKLSYQIADIEWAFERDKLYILQARPFVGRI